MKYDSILYEHTVLIRQMYFVLQFVSRFFRVLRIYLIGDSCYVSLFSYVRLLRLYSSLADSGHGFFYVHE
jgi:hypothetical protein